jgi:hypothetical protein
MVVSLVYRPVMLQCSDGRGLVRVPDADESAHGFLIGDLL